ncbi:MAG: helix-turn-helix domain-containing protein [Prevotella sp.]|nr:helix-turn-helix domain-containing protein [Prevotella sp.]
MEKEKTMLTTAEAAKYLGIKVSYLHKLMMRRVIPYYKPNGKLCFFDPTELDAWQRGIRISTQEEVDRQADDYITNARHTRQ